MQRDANRSHAATVMWIAMLMALAVFGRLLAHWPNFTPMVAVALFAGFLFRSWMGWLVPLLALVISDLVIGFYEPGAMALVYLGVLAAIAIGRATLGARPSVLALGGASLAGAIVFFILSNLGVWLFGGLYPLSGEGLAACFVAAIPFFKYTAVSTVLWTAALFGIHFLAQRLGDRSASPSVGR